MNKEELRQYCKDASLEISNMQHTIDNLQQENQQLKKQLEYLRSGEYLNQLKFERNMLENIVQNGEVSKEDKEFIDITHRNTELLEENQELKDRINKAIEYIENNCSIHNEEVLKAILKEDNKEKVDENN